jgi:hypothetical protein
MKSCAVLAAVVALSCSGSSKSPPKDPGRVGPGVTRPARDQLERGELNRLAVRRNLPVYWIADVDGDKVFDDTEAAWLKFYPPYAGDLDAAYQELLAAKAEPALDANDPDGQRRLLVREDLDFGRATLVANDLTTRSAAEKAFTKHMLVVADKIDELYSIMNGSAALASQLPADRESQSLFRRNRGAQCASATMEKNAACSAIPGAPPAIVDVYPPAIGGLAQTDPTFCEKLEKRKDAKTLLTPFTVVREVGGKLVAVSYAEAYQPQMTAIATELTAAAKALEGTGEQPLIDYLTAAAAGFTTNDWWPADEAWAKMNADNSKWYVRVGPDETYWEPCASKAAFHLTLSLINQGSKEWQDKLVPIQQEMEAAIAARAGAPYRAREVNFHLPDFIDIVVNAGDDRNPLGATIGQSLPNVGPVAKESRGRTIAMVNLYTDADSVASRRASASSLLDTASLAGYVDDPVPGLLSTVLHEATHNLGPAQEYAVKNKPIGEIFGGPMDSLLEELKAQTGTLFLIDMLRTKGIVSDELATQIYTDAVVWALGQTSQGMYTTIGRQRKTYPQLAAIQIGYLLDSGALSWDANATAANGQDKGAFTIHMDKLVAASEAMMKLVAGIKARGDKKAAEALAAKYVDGKVVPHAVIVERFARQPRGSMVYAVTL